MPKRPLWVTEMVRARTCVLEAPNAASRDGWPRSHADASTRHGDVPSIGTDANPTARSWKPLEYPKRSRSCRTHLLALRDGASVGQMALEAMRTRRLCARSPDEPRIGYDTDTAESEAQNISTHPVKLKYVTENEKRLQTKRRTLERVERS